MMTNIMNIIKMNMKKEHTTAETEGGMPMLGHDIKGVSGGRCSARHGGDSYSILISIFVVAAMLCLSAAIPSNAYAGTHDLGTETDSSPATVKTHTRQLMVTITSTASSGGVDVTKAIIDVLGGIVASDIDYVSAEYGGVEDGRVTSPTSTNAIGVNLNGNTKGGSNWTFYILLKASAAGKNIQFRVSSITGAQDVSPFGMPITTASKTVQLGCNATTINDVQLDGKTKTSIKIKWTNNAGNNYYKIYRQREDESQMTLYVPNTTVNPYDDTGLLSLTKYAYIVNGYDSTNVCESIEGNTLVSATLQSDDYLITTCGGCHPTPPDDSPQNRGVPDGATIGRHANPYHTGGVTADETICIKCHTSHIGTPAHRNGKVEMNTTAIYGISGSYYDKDRNKTKSLTIDNGFTHDNNPLSTADLSDNGYCMNTWCHGSRGASPVWGSTSGNAQCNICHGMYLGSLARDTEGHTNAQDEQVGAHDVHLHSTGATFVNLTTANPCTECHVQPAKVNDTGHFIDSGDPAELTFGALATNGGAVAPQYSAATWQCTNTYCHDGRNFKNGWATAANVTVPVWNNTSYLSVGGGSANCINKCHGWPPAGSHDVDTDCSSCHTHVASDDITFNSNFYLHMDGTVESTGASGCVGCHNGIPSGALYVTRNVVGGDFAYTSRHVYGSSVTNWDCIVCHREGDATQASSGKASKDLTMHNSTSNPYVNMRNVDSVSNGWTWNKYNKTATDHFNMDKFCLTCHDSDGASAINVKSTYDGVNLNNLRASTPFSKTTVGGSVTPGAARTAVIDVKTQFATGTYAWTAGNGTMPSGFTGGNYNGNPSTHAVLGPRYANNNASWTAAAWRPKVLKSGQTINSVREKAQLHCADCHMNDRNAHGSPNPFMLNSTSIDSTCWECHTDDVYSPIQTQETLSRWSHEANDGSRTLDPGRATTWGSTCLNCHAGYGYGDIHGMSGTYKAGVDEASGNTYTRYRFMPGAYMIYEPDKTNKTFTASGSDTVCYFRSAGSKWTSLCSQHDGGSKDGTYTPNYARGTAY